MGEKLFKLLISDFSQTGGKPVNKHIYKSDIQNFKQFIEKKKII